MHPRAQLEAQGDVTPIEFGDTNTTFTVPEGAKVLLTFPKADKTVLAATTDIRALRLLRSRTLDKDLVELTLEVFPKDLANELNRSLYTDPSASTDSGSIEAY